MDNFKTYGSWYRLLKQYRPDAGAWQVQNLALLLVGLYQARHVYLSRIVQKWPVRAKLVSLTRRLSRFLDQGGVVVRDWYGDVARQWLAAYAGGEIHLITLAPALQVQVSMAARWDLGINCCWWRWPIAAGRSPWPGPG